MHHSDFITLIASIYKPSIYIELGLYEGETFSKVIPYVKEAHGIDMVKKPSLDLLSTKNNVKIHYMTTDVFFESNNMNIDMAFIDADHSSISALKDFENCLSRLNPGGVIFMHDTDPCEDRLIHPGYCGDSFKIVPILEKRNDINIITFPITEAGLSMITKKDDTRTKRRGTALF